jgi:NAD(P)-dependent dehydrogenase (short-subunit alcohol dehydrogenase family)
VIADVQADALDRTRVELEAMGADVLAVKTDVSKAEQVQALADATLARFGVPHLVFNNAGVASTGALSGKARSVIGTGGWASTSGA